jgi:hypothetical protein
MPDQNGGRSLGLRIEQMISSFLNASFYQFLGASLSAREIKLAVFEATSPRFDEGSAQFSHTVLRGE